MARVLDRLDIDLDSGAGLLGRDDFLFELELDALLGEDLLEALGDFHVDALTANVWQEFNASDLGTESAPN